MLELRNDSIPNAGSDVNMKRDGLPALGTFSIPLCFIFGFLITHEVSFQDTLQLCLILILDLITGSFIWTLLSRKNKYSVFELLGVGIVLGTSVNAIAQLLLRGTFLQPLFNYVILIFVGFLYLQARRTNTIVMELSHTENSTVLGVCSIALVLLCGDRHYLWFGVLILGLAILVLKRIERSPITTRPSFLSIMFSLGSIALALLISSKLESVMLGPRTTASYIRGWDGVYAEASSKSISNYGPFDNIFLANTKNAYHWFSYAWAGSIDNRSQVSDWIVTTQFGFIISALATISLVVAILQSISRSKQIGAIPFGIVAATSLFGSSNFLLDTGSFSQSISILYLTMTFFVTKELLAHATISNIVLMVFSISLLTLTKLTVAIPLISGLCLFTIFTWFSDLPRKQKSFISIGLLLTGIASLILFTVFINQEARFQNSQSEFDIKIVANAFGIGTGVLFVDIGLLLIVKFVAICCIRIVWDLFSKLLVSVIVVSLLMSIVISSRWVTSANTNLLLPFSLATGLLIAVHFIQRENQSTNSASRQTWPLYFSSIIGASLGFITTTLLYYFHHHYVANNNYYLFVSLIPLISVVPISVISLRNSVTISRRKNFTWLLAVAFLASPAGSFVAHSFRDIERNIIFANNSWDLPIEDIETPRRRLQGTTDFISATFGFTDVFADNSTNNILISASTGIRSYASTYGRTFSIGHDDRYIAQIDFAKNADLSNYKHLRNTCVTIFYYDKGVTLGKAKSFEPYASIIYEDDFGAVLKLSESHPLSAECFK